MHSGSPTAKEAKWPGLSPAETLAWLQRYQRHSRIYAWGFFLLLLPIVFVVIWRSMGELNEDVFLSLGFFAFVTFLLAFFSQRDAASQWVGEVKEKTVKITRVLGAVGRADARTVHCFLEVVTKQGKQVRVRATRDVFDYFEIGDGIFKAPALNWPEKTILTEGRRICPCCGAILQIRTASCERCRAPVLDHETLYRFAARQ